MTPDTCPRAEPAELVPVVPTDVVVNVRLIDPSTEDQAGLADGVELLVFCPRPERMPQSRKEGDILRLHKVQVRPALSA